MTQAFSPTEIFKRATASTLRAIAERDDLTVGFGPEPAGVAGTRVKLPNPARDLPADEAAQLRGAADSLALRLRYHDDAVHSKRVRATRWRVPSLKGSNRLASRRWARGAWPGWRSISLRCSTSSIAARATSGSRSGPKARWPRRCVS